MKSLLCAGEKMKKYIKISIFIVIYLFLIWPSLNFFLIVTGNYEIMPNFGVFSFLFFLQILPGALIDYLFSLIISPSGHIDLTGYIACIFNIVLWTYTCLLVYFKGGKFLSELKGNQNIKKDKSQEI